MKHFLIVVFAFCITSCAQDNYTKFAPIYNKITMDTVPNYGDLAYWAAHPNKVDPSDSVPKPILKKYRPNQLVDVFFLYPTSYLDPKKPYGWSASFNDTKTNIYTDYTSVLNQASIFNEIGSVYAPRYRQAHIQSYYPISKSDSINAIAAFEIAYQDIKKAFEYYLKNYNNNRPIIIASHSQGSTHAIRLLQEYFDEKPLSKKLVAAYIVGMAVNPTNFKQLKACTQPDATGCILSWRTYLEGYTPPFIQNETFTSIVTNPLSWNSNKDSMDRFSNEGSVLYNFNKVARNVAGAKIHAGLLWTEKPKFLGSLFFKTKNYHVADYNFYYLSIRKNAATRVHAFFNNNSGANH